MSEDGKNYHVWSHEHGGWWAAPSGYTRSLSQARLFSRVEALKVCLEAIRGTAQRNGALPELPIAAADLHFLRDAYRSTYPGVQRETWE